jgi:hypothetical protein
MSIKDVKLLVCFSFSLVSVADAVAVMFCVKDEVTLLDTRGALLPLSEWVKLLL